MNDFFFFCEWKWNVPKQNVVVVFSYFVLNQLEILIGKLEKCAKNFIQSLWKACNLRWSWFLSEKWKHLKQSLLKIGFMIFITCSNLCDASILLLLLRCHFQSEIYIYLKREEEEEKTFAGYGHTSYTWTWKINNPYLRKKNT